MNTDKATGAGSEGPPPRDPGWFEDWLCDRLNEERDRQDEVGRVARWVLRENREGRWPPEDILLARNGHAYDVPAYYERVLKHCANQDEESVQTFFRVYDLYLKDALAEYDGKVEARIRRIGEGPGGGENSSGGKGAATTSGDNPAKKTFPWESWAQFYYELHGPEMVGYEIDEDGYPISREPEDGVEGR